MSLFLCFHKMFEDTNHFQFIQTNPDDADEKHKLLLPASTQSMCLSESRSLLYKSSELFRVNSIESLQSFADSISSQLHSLIDKNNTDSKTIDDKLITFNTRRIYSSHHIYEYIKYIRRYQSFSPIDHNEIKYLQSGLNMLNNRFSTIITLSQFIKIRDIVVSQSAKDKTFLIRKKLPMLLKDYNDGVKPIHIARRQKLPPISTMKHLLFASGISWKKISLMFQQPNNQTFKLYNEIVEVQENDHSGKTNLLKINARAQQFEKSVATYLKTLDIEFQTEQDLRLQQINQTENGLPYATPDFYFPQPIKINVDGQIHEINWLDVKDYTLIYIPLIIDSIDKQGQKYNTYFGKGAFMFSGGLTDSVTVDADVVLIDGSFIC